jgi:hypothetical protein
VRRLTASTSTPSRVSPPPPPALRRPVRGMDAAAPAHGHGDSARGVGAHAMRSTRPACRHRTSRMFHAVAAVARCESLRASNGPLTLHTGHTEGTAGADQVAPLGGARGRYRSLSCGSGEGACTSPVLEAHDGAPHSQLKWLEDERRESCVAVASQRTNPTHTQQRRLTRPLTLASSRGEVD